MDEDAGKERSGARRGRGVRLRRPASNGESRRWLRRRRRPDLAARRAMCSRRPAAAKPPHFCDEQSTSARARRRRPKRLQQTLWTPLLEPTAAPPFLLPPFPALPRPLLSPLPPPPRFHSFCNWVPWHGLKAAGGSYAVSGVVTVYVMRVCRTARVYESLKFIGMYP